MPTSIPWLDDDAPHDALHSAAQIETLVERFGDPASPARVLELGCGAGRVLGPLVEAGCMCTGIDTRDIEIPGGMIVRGDFLTDMPWRAFYGPDEGGAQFDAVLCLGNTFMTVAEIDDALALVRRVREHLAPRGVFIIDDLPHDFWPEVAEGNWQAGVSEDESMQIVWHDADALFALRMGEDVDPDDDALRPGERVFRMWTLGGLRLLAAAAGLSAPEHDAAGHLLIFTSE